MTRFYVIVALIVFAAGIGASLYWRGHRSGYAAGFAAEKSAYDKHLEADRLAQLAAQVDARRKEYQLSTAVAAAAKSYEQGKADAESAAKKLSPICALALCACASNGVAVKPPPVCPQLPPPPPSLMVSTDYVEQVRAILFESSEPAKPKSTDSKPP